MLRIRSGLLSRRPTIIISKSFCSNQRYQEPYQGGERNFWKSETKVIPPIPPKRYVRKAFSILLVVISSFLVTLSLTLALELEKHPEIIELFSDPEVSNDSKDIILSLSQLYLNENERNRVKNISDEEYKSMHSNSMEIALMLLSPARYMWRLFGVTHSEIFLRKTEVRSILSKLHAKILDDIKKKESNDKN